MVADSTFPHCTAHGDEGATRMARTVDEKIIVLRRRRVLDRGSRMAKLPKAPKLQRVFAEKLWSTYGPLLRLSPRQVGHYMSSKAYFSAGDIGLLAATVNHISVGAGNTVCRGGSLLVEFRAYVR